MSVNPNTLGAGVSSDAATRPHESLLGRVVHTAGAIGHEALRTVTMRGHLPEVAFPSEHAVPVFDATGAPEVDDRGERVFRLREPGDLHVHQNEAHQGPHTQWRGFNSTSGEPKTGPLA